MKKLLLISLAVMLAVPSFSQSEVSTDKNVLKVNTLSLFLGTGSIFYERGFSEMISGQLGIGYLNYGTSGTKFSGLFLTPEVRIYPKKNAIDGFYIAPYLRYQKFSLTNDANEEGSLSSMGGGLAFGRQWITNSGFTMDLFFGGHYGSSSVKSDFGEESFSLNAFQGFKPRIGFALGFAF